MEEDGQGKKSKKSSKREILHEDEKVAKNSKKMSQESSLDDISQSLEIIFKESSKELPYWLTMTDSEDEFQKPKEKPKPKKRRIESEESETEPEAHDDDYYEEDSQVKFKHSPKKKKKKRQVEEEDVCIIKKEPVSPKSPKKSKKQTASELYENGYVTDEVHSTPEKSKKLAKKSLKDAEQTPGKKKSRTRSKSPGNLFNEHEELVSDTEQPVDHSGETVKAAPKKSPANLTQAKPPTAKSLQGTTKDPAQPIGRAMRTARVPEDDHVTVGEEYKMKSVNEKCCKSCNEPVKIKTKTMVRDMGTQTLDSVVLRGMKPRGRPRSSSNVKTVAPVSVNDIKGKGKGSKQVANDDDDSNDAKNPCSLTEEQIQKLRNMTVSLKYAVLPQHDVETSSGCRQLTLDEKRNFETFETLKLGSWLAEEDRILTKNWRKFCKRHGWDPQVTQPFSKWKHGGMYYIPKLENRKKFVQFLAHNLPHRSLHHVHARFNNLFSIWKTDRYRN